MEAVSLVTHTDIVDGSAVVSVTGDVDLVSAAHLREVMEDALGRSSALIVDVADMTFIDSSGLSALVHAHRHAADAGGSMTVRHPSATLKRLLTITRLDTVLVVDDAGAGTSTTGREA
jgi:anti-sigma B factor antagonist